MCLVTELVNLQFITIPIYTCILRLNCIMLNNLRLANNNVKTVAYYTLYSYIHIVLEKLITIFTVLL